MSGLTAEQVKNLLDKVRMPELTVKRKADFKNLAVDLLSTYSSPDELNAKYVLYIMLANKLTL